MSPDSPVSPERSKLTPITQLNYLVHPLWRTQPYDDDFVTVNQFIQKRSQLSTQICQRMLPKSVSEVTCFVPHIVNDSKTSEIRGYKKAIEQRSQYFQWTDLYRQLVSDNKFPRNLLMAPNLVEILADPGQIDVNPRIFTDFLVKKGFRLTSDTNIVVGGECLFPCVLESIYQPFQLREVKQLHLDPQATLTMGYLSNPDFDDDQQRYQMFGRQLKDV